MTTTLTAPGVPATGQAADHGHPPVRVQVAVAFYGRTNQGAVAEGIRIARQHRVCQDSLTEVSVITRVYYDMTWLLRRDHPASLTDAVRDAGGPRRRDGGWLDLADALPDPDRGFDLIIMESPDRLSRDITTAIACEDLAARHGVPIHCACDRALTAALYRSRVLATKRQRARSECADARSDAW